MSKIENRKEHFMELYIPVRRQISNYCRTLTRNEYLAGDLLQDTLLSAFEGMEYIRKKESFLFYLCATAKRIYLKQKRRNKYVVDSEEMVENETISSEKEAMTNIDIQILYKAIDQLPEKQREVIVLFEIIGFSIKEIKAIQGGSMSGVKSRIVRAREKLTSLMSDSEIEEQKIGNQKIEKI